MTIEELDRYLASDQGQKRLKAAVTTVLRQATGPDDASQPAGVWFGEVIQNTRDLLGRTPPPA
jgi:hypothetical protein